MEQPTEGTPGPWLGWIGAVAVAAALGFVAMIVWGPAPVETSSGRGRPVEPTIAVLPLLDLTGSGDPVVAQAIVSELQVGLAMVPGLQVRGRLSSSAFTDVNRDAAHAGATLGAAAVLDGSVRKTGRTLRLSLRLLDTRDRTEIWSDATETSIANIFDWRDSVVSAVAFELGRPIERNLLRRLAARRTTEESFEHYAAGRFRWAEGASGDLVEALAEYDLALEADSGFAPTWTAIAHAYASLPRFTRFPVELVRSDGIAAARTALRLDPDGARAHMVLGEILYLYEHDFVGAGSHLARALELEAENGEALLRLCELRMLEGETDAARVHCDRALVADPLSFQAAWLTADLAKIGGDHERAVASLDSLRLLYPDYIPLAADVALTRLLTGDSAEARRDLGYWFQLLGGNAERAADLWGDDPRRALSRVAAELDPEASNLAALGAQLGEREIALDAAESAVEAGLPGAVRFLVFPEFDGLRGSPRFDALVAEILSGRRDGDTEGST